MSEDLAENLAGIINVPEKELLKKLREIANLKSFYPVTIAKDISREELLLVEKSKRSI